MILEVILNLYIQAGRVAKYGSESNPFLWITGPDPTKTPGSGACSQNSGPRIESLTKGHIYLSNTVMLSAIKDK